MEVSGQLHAPATFTPRERASGTRCIGGGVDSRAGLDAVVESEIPIPCRDSNPPIIHPVAQRYTTELTGANSVRFTSSHCISLGSLLFSHASVGFPNNVFLHLQGALTMEAVRASETLGNTTNTTRRIKPDLGRTQPPIKWVPGVKRLGREADHSTSTYP
jgi:hypothetical protein